MIFCLPAGVVPAYFAFSKPERLSAQTAGWRTFEVTTRVEVLKPSGTTHVWLPTALVTDTPYQRTLTSTFKCDGGAAKKYEKTKTDALGIVAAEFPPGVTPIIAVTNRVATRNWMVDFSVKGKTQKASAAELEHFLRPTKLLPTDGIVKETADEITAAPTRMSRKHARSTNGSSRIPSGIRRRGAAASAISASCWSPRIWAASAPISTRSTLVSRAPPVFPRATSMASASPSPSWDTRASAPHPRT